MPLHGISNCRLSAVTQWHGENYRDIATLQRSIASKTLAGLVLEGYECALDVGCSDGTITMQLAERVSPRGRVLGIDTSTSMIAFARLPPIGRTLTPRSTTF
jgi:trans-aconitate 2-methyltransferase